MAHLAHPDPPRIEGSSAVVQKIATVQGHAGLGVQLVRRRRPVWTYRRSLRGGQGVARQFRPRQGRGRPGKGNPSVVVVDFGSGGVKRLLLQDGASGKAA